MSKRDIISAVLYILGLLTCLGGIGVLIFYNIELAVWSDECGSTVAVLIIGIAMMVVSFVLDRHKRKGGDEDGRNR